MSKSGVFRGAWAIGACLPAMAALGPVAALGQEAAPGEEAVDEIIVRESRLPASSHSFPGSLTVIGSAEIDRQRAFNKDPISLLSNEVPGFGTSPGSISNFDTPLRGRSAVVLIDGVPITPTLRPAGRDIVSINPSSIARIEVIRGASSLYGNGGAGGVINYITKRPLEDGVSYTSEFGLGLSATHPGDSLNPTLLQSVEGRRGRFDFIASAYLERINSMFDADGDRIPPSQTGNGGLPDSDIVNLFGKLGYEWNQQRIEATVLHFDIGQDTNYFAQPGDLATRSKATAVTGTVDPRAEDEGNRNTVFNVVYSHADVLGSTLRLQGYHQKVEQTFDFRADRFGGSQTLIDSEKYGARLDFNTPLNLGSVTGNVLWGLDYTNDETAQLLTDGRVFVPFLDQDAFAQFLQLDLPLTSWLDVQAGVRHESFDVRVKPFTSLSNGNDIEGGKLDYSATVYNVGLVLRPNERFDVFAAFSQGFSLSDLGREIRDTADPQFVERLKPEPVVYDNYELGVRFHLDRVRGGVTSFYSESDLGQRLVADPDNPGLLIQRRDPERVYGYEAWANADLSGSWRLGGTLTKLEGKFDSNVDGHFDSYLDSRRIAPLKVTAFTEYTRDKWLFRLQSLYSGSRDKWNDSLVRGLGRADSFIIFDLLAAVELGRGEASVGIQNVLNRDYYSVSAQTQNVADRLVKAPGATLFARYRIKY